MSLNLERSQSSINASYFLYCNSHGARKLSPTFTPGPYDVICSRGKAVYNHEGNQRFRALVKLNKDAYASATSKYEKSQIVTHIRNTVRQATPEGGFVKLIDGIYHEVGDRTASEKIGQTFRDLLHTKYSSSTKAKARSRIQKRVEEFRSESPTTGVQAKEDSTTNDAGCSSSVTSGHSQSDKKECHLAPIMNITVDNALEKRVEHPLLISTSEEGRQQTAFDFEPLPLVQSSALVTDSISSTTASYAELIQSYDDDMQSLYQQYILNSM